MHSFNYHTLIQNKKFYTMLITTDLNNIFQVSTETIPFKIKSSYGWVIGDSVLFL